MKLSTKSRYGTRLILDMAQRYDQGAIQLGEIDKRQNISMKYLEHFLESFAHGLGATINVMVENPDEDLHTTIETVFKSLGMALDEATQIDPRRDGSVPSTKGIID